MKISIVNKLFHEDLSISFRGPLVLFHHKISRKSFLKLSDHFENIFVFNFVESLLIEHDATAINFIYFICDNIIFYQSLEAFQKMFFLESFWVECFHQFCDNFFSFVDVEIFIVVK